MPKGEHSRHWQRSDWFSLAAMIIALFALSVSVAQYVDARLHDQPRMTYEFDFEAPDGAGWFADNIGLGPAVLRGFKIIVDGTTIHNFDEFQAALALPEPARLQIRTPRVGTPYPVGYSGHLFWIAAPTKANIDRLNTIWTKVAIQACYCSIHHQCWR